MEDNVVGHANTSLVILIMLALTHPIWQTPTSSSFAIWTCHFLLLRLINSLVPTHIYEGLLVKELLPCIADHLLTEGLDAEASIRLDKHGAHWELTALLHLSQVLIVLWPMLWV